MKGRERGGGEADRVGTLGKAEGPKLGVLLHDRGRGRGLVEEVACEVAGERDDRDARVRRDSRDDLEELRAPGTRWRRGADDDARSRLDDETPDPEGEALGVAGRERSRASDLPGVESGVLDSVGRGQEREDARVTAGWFSFEHRRGATSESVERRRRMRADARCR